jgi:MFS family permease
VLAQKLGWRWIFWFLVILTGTYLVIVLFLLPETQRKIVGNGSVPARGIHRSAFDSFTRNRKAKGDQERGTVDRRKHHIPNPFKCILMLRSKGNLAVIMIGSITYVVKMMLQTSLAAQCTGVYNLNYLQAGLIYLPSGVGGAIASYTTGMREYIPGIGTKICDFFSADLEQAGSSTEI